LIQLKGGVARWFPIQRAWPHCLKGKVAWRVCLKEKDRGLIIETKVGVARWFPLKRGVDRIFLNGSWTECLKIRGRGLCV
jgi:hypothetical protein